MLSLFLVICGLHCSSFLFYFHLFIYSSSINHLLKHHSHFSIPIFAVHITYTLILLHPIRGTKRNGKVSTSRDNMTDVRPVLPVIHIYSFIHENTIETLIVLRLISRLCYNTTDD